MWGILKHETLTRMKKAYTKGREIMNKSIQQVSSIRQRGFMNWLEKNIDYEEINRNKK
jgi:hypothetical protein